MWFFLRSPGSNWCEPLAELCRHQGGDVRLLELPRALSAAQGESEIALDDGALTWGEVGLEAATLFFIERPLYSWPQTAGRDPQQAQAEREARALALSALHVLSRRVTTVNALRAGHWAAHPAAALDELSQRGLTVHPWRLLQRDPADSAAGTGVRFDPVGRALGYEPRAPAVGEPVRGLVGAPALPAWKALVIGAGVVAAQVLETAAELACEPGEHALQGPEVPSDSSAVAVASAQALELDFCTVTVAADGRVLDLDSAPDLSRWDRATRGTVQSALRTHLFRRTQLDQTRGDPA